MNPTDYGTAVTTGHDPTRHQPADGLDTLHPQTRRLVLELTLHQVPTDHGRDRAGQVLTRAGVTWRTDNLSTAIAWRKNNPPTTCSNPNRDRRLDVTKPTTSPKPFPSQGPG